MQPRCVPLRCASVRCDSEARYIVSARVPRETEHPRLCLVHATDILRNGMVPHALMYGKADDGHGWMVAYDACTQ